MPGNYAHQRFGRQILSAMPAEARQCVQRFRRMYDMGLHGPDIFFYYNPYVKTAAGALGKTYHRKTGREFFPAACAAARSEAARAYLYGLLAHYCLDSCCHPYVRSIAQIGEASHVGLETEFDRFLLALDKEPSPETYDTGKRLKLTRGECMTVAEFYPPATGGQVSVSVSSLRFSTKFLSSPNWHWREAVLKRIKPVLLEYRVPERENPELAPYIAELKTLYDAAVENYPRLLTRITDYMGAGEPLGEEFDPDFG